MNVYDEPWDVAGSKCQNTFTPFAWNDTMKAASRRQSLNTSQMLDISR
jgi:hypothetical protein